MGYTSTIYACAEMALRRAETSTERGDETNRDMRRVREKEGTEICAEMAQRGAETITEGQR